MQEHKQKLIGAGTENDAASCRSPQLDPDLTCISTADINCSFGDLILFCMDLVSCGRFPILRAKIHAANSIAGHAEMR